MTKFSLKLKFGNDNRRVSVEESSFDAVVQMVKRCFRLPHAFIIFIKFVDEEGDICSITNNEELQEAFSMVSGKTLTLLVSSPSVVKPTKSATTTPIAKAAVQSGAGNTPRDVRTLESDVPDKVAKIEASIDKSRAVLRKLQEVTESKKKLSSRKSRSDLDTDWRAKKEPLDPDDFFSRTHGIALQCAEKALGEGLKFLSGNAPYDVCHEFMNQAHEEGKKLWEGGKLLWNVDAPLAKMTALSEKVQKEASKIFLSQDPYDWQRLAKDPKATAKDIMDCARKEASALQKKFMIYVRTEINKLHRDTMKCAQDLAKRDWKKDIDSVVKDAKSQMKIAKSQARNLIKLAKAAQKEKNNSVRDVLSSSDDEGFCFEEAKTNAKNIKHAARAHKETMIKNGRMSANLTRKAKVSQARDEVETIRDRVLHEARECSKDFRKKILQEARKEAMKVRKDCFKYHSELERLKNMGFQDTEVLKILLGESDGDVGKVCEVLLTK